MAVSKDRIIEALKRQLLDFEPKTKIEDVGTVIDVGDGVASVVGLPNALASEMLEFCDAKGQSRATPLYGVALNLEQERIGVMLLGDVSTVRAGDLVKSTGRILEVPVGSELVGRVVNAFGEPIDGMPLVTKERRAVEHVAPGVIARQSVSVPLQTGIKAIDSMIPIGRGQRELIIGDRQTGKTAIAIDAIINQKGTGVICIYVAIGQKESKVARIVGKLKETGALDHTIVVVAGASDPAAASFIAPYAGCAMGEAFMSEGKDVLIIYDDLTKHAIAYREVSLLLRRPPGREAYPGDIFYLHSRLLERAARLSVEHGGGSLTALPIIETQAGDVAAYIPTNVISITDGQIYLEGDLFYQGQRPAVNAGLSVSRVGSAAQTKGMKKVAGKLRLELAQYRALASFAQFGSDLDETTRKQIERGKRLEEVLKQDQYVPMSTPEQIAIFWAAVNGILDAIPVEHIRRYEAGLLAFLKSHSSQVLTKLAEKPEITPEIEEGLKTAATDFVFNV